MAASDRSNELVKYDKTSQVTDVKDESLAAGGFGSVFEAKFVHYILAKPSAEYSLPLTVVLSFPFVLG